MKRARRIAVAISVLTVGCTALINVPDLELQSSDDGGLVDGANTLPDGAPIGTDGSSDGSFTGGDSAACNNANLATDPANCGQCGKSCNGLGCSNGACVPLVLADNLTTPYMIDGDATYLYFTTYSPATVQRVKKDGSAKAEVLVDSNITFAIGIHIGGNTLNFTANEGVFACDVSNGAISCAQTLAKIAPTADPSDLGSDIGPAGMAAGPDGNIYWIDQAGKIFRALPDGGARVAVMTNLDNQSPFSLAIGGNYLYATTIEQYNVISAQIDGGAAQDAGYLSSYLSDPYIAADTTGFAYAYIDYDTQQGHVEVGQHATRQNPTAVTPTSAAAAQPDGVGLDATYVYWTDRGTLDNNGDSNADGRLLRCARTGCTGDPTVLATGLLGGGPLLVDDKYVYVVENNDGNENNDNKGRIRKVLKP